MNKTILIIIVVLIVIVGVYFLLRGGYQTPAPTAPAPNFPGEEISPSPEEVGPATEEIAPPEEGATVSPTVKEFTVSGTEYSFNPSSITVSAGDRVRITFRNNGRVSHNLVIKDLEISTKTISAGQTDTIEFTAPASGTYTFICSVPGHAAAGMVGDLKVE